MEKKVKLIYPNSPYRWGLATTEHRACKDNQPIITQKDNVYSPLDIENLGIEIIVNDKKAVTALKKAGYNPISRKKAGVSRGISFPVDLAEKIKIESKKLGLNFSQVVVHIIRKYFDENPITDAIEQESIEFNETQDNLKDKIVRLNTTIPLSLKLKAQQARINFSQLLQKAIKEELNIDK